MFITIEYFRIFISLEIGLKVQYKLYNKYKLRPCIYLSIDFLFHKKEAKFSFTIS